MGTETVLHWLIFLTELLSDTQKRELLWKIDRGEVSGDQKRDLLKLFSEEKIIRDNYRQSTRVLAEEAEHTFAKLSKKIVQVSKVIEEVENEEDIKRAELLFEKNDDK